MSSLLVYSTCNQMQRDLFSVRFTLWLLDKEVPSLSWLMPEPRISVRNQVLYGMCTEVGTKSLHLPRKGLGFRITPRLVGRLDELLLNTPDHAFLTNSYPKLLNHTLL